MTGVAEGDGAKSPGVVVGSNGGSGSTRSASLSETTASLTSFSKMTGGNGKITSSEKYSIQFEKEEMKRKMGKKNDE